MADAGDGVLGEGPGDEELETSLGESGPGGDGGGHAGGLEVPAGQRGDEVGGAKDVQAASQEGSRDTLPDGAAQPRLSVVVNLEVRRHGPLEALLGQEAVGIAVGELFC